MGNGVSHCPQCDIVIETLVQIQLLLYAAYLVPRYLVLHTWETQMARGILALTWPSCSCCNYMGSKDLYQTSEE